MVQLWAKVFISMVVNVYTVRKRVHCSLLPFPRLSLALSLTFFRNLNALKMFLFGLHQEKCYINIYIQ